MVHSVTRARTATTSRLGQAIFASTLHRSTNTPPSVLGRSNEAACPSSGIIAWRLGLSSCSRVPPGLCNLAVGVTTPVLSQLESTQAERLPHTPTHPLSNSAPPLEPKRRRPLHESTTSGLPQRAGRVAPLGQMRLRLRLGCIAGLAVAFAATAAGVPREKKQWLKDYSACFLPRGPLNGCQWGVWRAGRRPAHRRTPPRAQCTRASTSPTSAPACTSTGRCIGRCARAGLPLRSSTRTAFRPRWVRRCRLPLAPAPALKRPPRRSKSNTMAAFPATSTRGG